MCPTQVERAGGTRDAWTSIVTSWHSVSRIHIRTLPPQQRTGEPRWNPWCRELRCAVDDRNEASCSKQALLPESARSRRRGMRTESVRGFAVGVKPLTAGESVDVRQSDGEILDAQAPRIVHDNPVPSRSWTLRAAGLWVRGLCVLRARCGSFLLLPQKQDNHSEHSEHGAEQAEQPERWRQDDRPRRCAAVGVAFRDAES